MQARVTRDLPTLEKYFKAATVLGVARHGATPATVKDDGGIVLQSPRKRIVDNMGFIQ